jgi:hypothetical protein
MSINFFSPARDQIYESLNSIQADHPGPMFIRKLFGHFSIDGLMAVINTLIRNIKYDIRQLLTALDFLHHEASIIHTGNTFTLPSMN